MASLRKASAYSKGRTRPYTRKSSVKKRSYIKAVPANKIVKYNLGNIKDYLAGKHTYIVRMISEEKVVMRDNALEACRTLVNKTMEKEAPGNFYFVIKVFPHHILRENKTAAGAGADRLSSGMKHSFGITVGRAAILKPGKEILFISCANEKVAQIAKRALGKVKSKVPCRNRIIFEKVS